MLAELMVYAASYRSTPPAFRPHLGEAVGLWARGQRQTRAWAPHLANSRGLIDTSIDDLTSRRTVVVLGSGPLFDVPIESLCRTFKRVLLVDRIHLSSIDKRIDRYSNVRRDWRDLSTANQPDALGFLDAIDDLDWVISLNLVSQLARAAPGAERAVVDAHLDRLATLRCPVTLAGRCRATACDGNGKWRPSARKTATPVACIRWQRGPTGATPDLTPMAVRPAGRLASR